MHHSDVIVKQARPGSGKGLFARSDIKRGQSVADYTGRRVPTKIADTLSTRYLFELDEDWTIDGSPRSNIARYINHSCKPNCEARIVRGVIKIYAKRAIPAGTEITIDYGDEYFNEFIRPSGCLCPVCKNN